MLRPACICVLAAAWMAQSARAQSTDTSAVNAVEAQLAEAAQLELIERVALERSPALAEVRARSAAAAQRASGADRFPDPEFKYEQWAVPLTRPYALNRADTLMFGVRQSFPAPGARAARSRARAEDAQVATHQRDALARDLILRVRRAYFDYYAADRVLRVHLEHVNVAEQVVAQVKSDYGVGRGNQQDVLKVLVELARLHNDLAEVRQQRESSRLLLNTLMARAPAAALGPPVALPQPSAPPGVEQLDAARAAERPELLAAQRSVRKASAQLDAATIAARRPSFMLGVDYWLMPTLDSPHAYGAMVAMSLPWLSAGRRADVREAEQLVAAERHAADAVEQVTAFEVHDALARLEAANSSLALLESSLLPEAEKSLEATRSAFALGQASLLSLLDAQRSYFQVRLEQSRAEARVMAQLAAVEFASGARLFAPPSLEKKP